VVSILNNELRVAQIEANGAAIEARRRINEVAMRLLVVGLSLASKLPSKK